MHSENLPFEELTLRGADRPARVRRGVDPARLMDITGALLVLVFLAPLMVMIVGLILVVDRAPPIFGHARIGRGGRTFKCLKFRSMRVNADELLRAHLARDDEARACWERQHKLLRDPRITPLGSLLRRSSLDELPQLFNVLRGDMSLVGPRPIVRAEIAKYGRYFVHYCRVRPGITGLWQVSGRSDTSYRRRVALDVTYVKFRTFWLDLRILALTLPAVILQKGSQ